MLLSPFWQRSYFLSLGARENARRSSCQSNLKQIGLGFVQYTQDYDEIMPLNGWGYVSATNNPGDWMDNIQPYVKSYQILKCPSDSNVTLPDVTNQVSSYAINMVGRRQTASADPLGPPFSRGDYMPVGTFNLVSISAVQAPSTTIFVADNNGNNVYQNAQDWADLTGLAINTTTPRNMNGNWSERHLETINTLFCDGHVKAVKLDYYREAGTGASAAKATHLTIGADPE